MIARAQADLAEQWDWSVLPAGPGWWGEWCVAVDALQRQALAAVAPDEVPAARGALVAGLLTPRTQPARAVTGDRAGQGPLHLRRALRLEALARETGQLLHRARPWTEAQAAEVGVVWHAVGRLATVVVTDPKGSPPGLEVPRGGADPLWLQECVEAVAAMDAAHTHARVRDARARKVADWYDAGGALAYAAVKKSERPPPVLGVQLPDGDVVQDNGAMAAAVADHWQQLFAGGVPVCWAAVEAEFPAALASLPRAERAELPPLGGAALRAAALRTPLRTSAGVDGLGIATLKLVPEAV